MDNKEVRKSIRLSYQRRKTPAKCVHDTHLKLDMSMVAKFQSSQYLKCSLIYMLCYGCGEVKDGRMFTAAQRKMVVGGICCKCNDDPGGGGAGSGDVGGNAGVPNELPPHQCANPSCKKAGKGYKLCLGCRRVHYCSER